MAGFKPVGDGLPEVAGPVRDSVVGECAFALFKEHVAIGIAHGHSIQEFKRYGRVIRTAEKVVQSLTGGKANPR